MEEILKTLDEELELLESRVGEKRIILKTKRVSEWAKCPVCGQSTQKVHSWYWKHVADLPAMGKMVILEVQRRLFLCTNPDCSQKRFSEPMEYLNWSGKRTGRLDNLIEKIAANHSAHGLEKILRNDIVDISDDSILRLIKKKNRTNPLCTIRRNRRFCVSKRSSLRYSACRSGNTPHFCKRSSKSGPKKGERETKNGPP